MKNIFRYYIIPGTGDIYSSKLEAHRDHGSYVFRSDVYEEDHQEDWSREEEEELYEKETREFALDSFVTMNVEATIRKGMELGMTAISAVTTDGETSTCYQSFTMERYEGILFAHGMSKQLKSRGKPNLVFVGGEMVAGSLVDDPKMEHLMRKP